MLRNDTENAYFLYFLVIYEGLCENKIIFIAGEIERVEREPLLKNLRMLIHHRPPTCYASGNYAGKKKA